MKQKVEATIQHVRCRTCNTMIQIPRPFNEGEIRQIECKPRLHKHDYTALDVRSLTSTALVGR